MQVVCDSIAFKVVKTFKAIVEGTFLRGIPHSIVASRLIIGLIAVCVVNKRYADKPLIA